MSTVAESVRRKVFPGNLYRVDRFPVCPAGDEFMAVTTVENRVAVITGGESGIGAACVSAFASAGADVAVLYLDDQGAAEKGCEMVRSFGRHAVCIKADVGEEQAVEAAFDTISTNLGVPNVLVNAAGGVSANVAVADMRVDQWERLIRTDLTGSFLTSRRFVRDLRNASRSGSIVNITSIHSTVGASGADYDAAKGGQLNLTRTLALETAKLGITVNAIAPGMILTPMHPHALKDEGYLKGIEKQIPLGRVGRADEVAGVALFLASPAATYITGSTITIDGGLSLEVCRRS